MKWHNDHGFLVVSIDSDPCDNYLHYIHKTIIDKIGATLVKEIVFIPCIYYDFKLSDIEFCLLYDDYMGLYLIALNEAGNKFLENLDMSIFTDKR